VVHGLQVRWRRGEGKLQGKPGHAGTLEHDVSLRGKWTERQTAMHLGESECSSGRQGSQTFSEAEHMCQYEWLTAYRA